MRFFTKHSLGRRWTQKKLPITLNILGRRGRIFLGLGLVIMKGSFLGRFTDSVPWEDNSSAQQPLALTLLVWPMQPNKVSFIYQQPIHCTCKSFDIPDHFLMIDGWCLANVSHVSTMPCYVRHVQITHQVNPPGHKQGPSPSVLDGTQNALQAKTQLANFVPRIFKHKRKLCDLGRIACCEEEREGVAVPVSLGGPSQLCILPITFLATAI